MHSPMDAAERDRWIKRRIPHRLHALDEFHWWLDRIERMGSDSIFGGAQMGIRVEINKFVLPPKVFTDRVVDGGLLSARWLMEFLGVVISGPNAVPRRLKRAPGGAADMRIDRLPPAKLIDPDVIRAAGHYDAVFEILRASNEGMLHPAHGENEVNLRLAVQGAAAIRDLTITHLYAKLGEPVPEESDFDVRTLGGTPQVGSRIA